jgi:diguanylate cyclase (GGDEF)-like protein/PAS domain S-box-containing protein
MKMSHSPKKNGRKAKPRLSRGEIESKVIFEIIRGVSTTCNLEELLALVQSSIGRVIYAENFYVALHDKETEMLRVPYCVDKYDTCAPPQKLGRGLTAYAIRRGEPTLLNQADVDRLCEAGEVESVGTSSAIWLGVPLRTPAGIIGVLVVQHYEDAKAYTERDIELLSSAAGQIAFAIERKRAEDTLRESEAILAAAQRITHLGSWELDLADLDDLNNNVVRWSDETYRIFGFEPGEVKVSNDLFYNAVHPDDRANVAEVLAEAIKEQKTFNIEHRVILPDATERVLHGRAELVFDEQTGRPMKLLGTVQDITERRRTDAALRESESKLRMLFTSMNEGLTQVDNNEVMELVNDRLCELTGYSREELVGKTTFDVFFDDEGRRIVARENEQRHKGVSGQYEARIRKKSGEMMWALISGAPIVNDDGVVTGTLGMFMDISERKRAEEQLLHDALHDGLTGLANRALFMDHLRLTIGRCKSRHANPYAVLFLDYDRFKVVNDSLGHAEGDELLKQIARRLELWTRSGDLVARFGGDEFVVLLTELAKPDDALEVARRIQDDLQRPFDINGSEVVISASIGIALSADGAGSAEEMLRDADIAMYSAKTKGRARYQVFNQAMRADATTRLQLETEMRQAIERGEFEVHYQPIMNLETNEIKGFEALVRWRHPSRGLIPPDEFIPAAEETGLILPLGRWILGESCRQMRAWQDRYPRAASLVVSVNLSAKQFLQSDLADQVQQALETTGLPSRCLKLEITESYLIENNDKAVKIMNRLRDIGVELSLDDFGTGYSSLSYLHRLPVNSLKIDRSFVSRMSESGENSEIVRTIVKLAQNLNMDVIAEGIETNEQLAQLNDLRCGFGQGYLFAKPMPAEAAAAFIDENVEKLSGIAEQPVISLVMDM